MFLNVSIAGLGHGLGRLIHYREAGPPDISVEDQLARGGRQSGSRENRFSLTFMSPTLLDNAERNMRLRWKQFEETRCSVRDAEIDLQNAGRESGRRSGIRNLGGKSPQKD